MKKIGVLSQVDLEKYRYKIHCLSVPKKSENESWARYWQEVGAFASILPRQTGKTTMLFEIAQRKVEKNEKCLFVRGIFTSDNRFEDLGIRCESAERLIHSGIWMANNEDTHLLVDEFMWVDKNDLRRIMGTNWKSVVMVSSL